MKNYFLCITITAFLLISCSNTKDAQPFNIIPVESTVGNYNILNLSEYATEIRYIPLETNNIALISKIHQIIFESEKILILDKIPASYTSNCYLFDNNGKFRRKIGQFGQGPDDYYLITQVLIHENLIFLKDYFKILIYDINGYLIGKINLKSNEIPAEYISHGLFEIFPLKKDTFVMNVISMSGYYPKAVLTETYQSNLRIIKEYPNYLKLDKLPNRFSTDELGFMYLFKDDVRTYKVFNDTIFSVSQNTGINDAFIFELGKYKPALSYIEGKEDYFSGRMNYIIPQKIFESLSHLFVEFSFGNYAPEPIESINRQGGRFVETRVNSIFDKSTGKFTLMSQPVKGKFGFNNDIDNGPVIWPQYISSNNELVASISVEEFIDYYDKIENPSPQMTEIAEKIKMDDNQIVIIAKLK